MAVEDFTSANWVQTDPNNHIGLVNTNHVDFADYRNEDAYFRRDMGGGHFTDFTHLIDVRINSHSGNNIAYCWMLSNDVDDVKALNTASKTFLTLELGFYSTAYYMEISKWTGGAETHSAAFVPVATTWYYLKIIRDGANFTCEVYSDAARTNLLDTLDVGGIDSGWNFEYVFVCNTYNSGHAYYGDEDIENLDLQEGGAPPAGQQLFTLINQEDY
jgi:hypothetical protein